MGIAVCNVPGYGVEEVHKKYHFFLNDENGIEILTHLI